MTNNSNQSVDSKLIALWDIIKTLVKIQVREVIIEHINTQGKDIAQDVCASNNTSIAELTDSMSKSIDAGSSKHKLWHVESVVRELYHSDPVHLNALRAASPAHKYLEPSALEALLRVKELGGKNITYTDGVNLLEIISLPTGTSIQALIHFTISGRNFPELNDKTDPLTYSGIRLLLEKKGITHIDFYVDDSRKSCESSNKAGLKTYYYNPNSKLFLPESGICTVPSLVYIPELGWLK